MYKVRILTIIFFYQLNVTERSRLVQDTKRYDFINRGKGAVFHSSCDKAKRAGGPHVVY